MYVVKLDMNLGLSLGWLFVILLPLKLIVLPFVTWFNLRVTSPYAICFEIIFLYKQDTTTSTRN